jgi:glycosyltransferase involved in cell wall biosynthesis
MLSIPFVVRLRGDYWHEMREAYDYGQSARERLAAHRQLWLVRLAVRHADLIIPVSLFLKERTLAEIGTLDPARIVPAPVYIDLERFSAIESKLESRQRLQLVEEMVAVCTVTNFAYRAKAQGLLDMLAVLDPLLKKNRGLHWLIAGGGPFQSWFSRTVLSQAQCADKIHFLGHCSDITAVYRASDLVLHFSSMDTFPNTVLEAQACERPVIVSSYGGMPEQIIAGETGYVVDPQETEAVQALVESLLNDSEHRSRMGRAGRQFVETHYSYAAVGEHFARALESLACSSDSKARAGRLRL